MEKIIGEKTYKFNCKLGTTVKIKKKFNKPFNAVLSEIENYDTEQLIKLLYCGLDESEHTIDSFTADLFDNYGLMDLYELVQSFIKQIQYPGLTEEEIDEKLKEKNEQAQKLSNTTL